MSITFCPLEADWGNFADWATVAVGAWGIVAATTVGIGAAGATLWVAMLAHRTSKRAAQIAERATLIAQQQHDEAVQSRQANARIVGRLLVHEVSALPERVWMHHLRSARERPKSSDGPEVHEQYARHLVNMLKLGSKPLLPGTELSQDRIHTLPDELGNDLARLLGFSRTMMTRSEGLLPQFVEVQLEGQPPRLRHVASSNYITEYLQFLRQFSELSLEFAPKFREFVGEPVMDFSNSRIGSRSK